MLQYTCCSGPGSATLGLATSSRLHHFTGKTTELDRRTHRGEFGTAARALLMAAKAKVGPDGCRLEECAQLKTAADEEIQGEILRPLILLRTWEYSVGSWNIESVRRTQTTSGVRRGVMGVERIVLCTAAALLTS